MKIFSAELSLCRLGQKLPWEFVDVHGTYLETHIPRIDLFQESVSNLATHHRNSHGVEASCVGWGHTYHNLLLVEKNPEMLY